MPKLISHRGKLAPNDDEPNTEIKLEKKLEIINNIDLMIEIDFWIDSETIKVGHEQESSFSVSCDLLKKYHKNILAHIKNPTQNFPYELLTELKIESFVHSIEPVIFTSKATPFCHSSLCNKFKYSKDISLIMPEKVMSKKELSSHFFSNPFLLTEHIDTLNQKH